MDDAHVRARSCARFPPRLSAVVTRDAVKLDIRGLKKRYGAGVQALDGVSLEIPPGMFGLLGPNGAGKSTLMRILATLQDADEGTITLGELDVVTQKEEVRKRLGYLPQEFGLYPKVTAHDLLDHLATLKGIRSSSQRKEIVLSLLTKTNLFDVRHRKLGTFSGGMKQRFGIAQALLGDPKLIIVDEPTAGLDPEERARFHHLLADIGQHIIVVLSTHIVSDVADLCPRVAILCKGNVVRHGEPATLVRELEGRLFRRYADREELPALEAAHAVISTRRHAGRLLVHVFAEAAPDALFEPVTPDLEDLYFHALRQSRIALT